MRLQSSFMTISALAISCSSGTPPTNAPAVVPSAISEQTLLRYSSASSDWSEEGEVTPWSMCYFAGPDQTVALVTVVEAPTPVFICDAWDSPYADTFEALAVSPAGVAAGADLTGKLGLVQIDSGMSTAMTGAGRQVRVGDTLLVSIREARGTWFISRWVFAEVVADDVTSDDDTVLDLPSRWGDFIAKATDVRANYTDRCDATSVRGAHLSLSAADFEAMCYTRRTDIVCGPVPIEGDEPAEWGLDP